MQNIDLFKGLDVLVGTFLFFCFCLFLGAVCFANFGLMIIAAFLAGACLIERPDWEEKLGEWLWARGEDEYYREPEEEDVEEQKVA